MYKSSRERTPGLPDGLFSNQKPNLRKFWRDFDWIDIFYGHLEYFTDIWDI
jgi:hypothetical protein